MKVIIQRVTKASVKVNSKIVGKIDNGLMLLVGVTHDDTTSDVDYLVRKIINMRIFDDEDGIMNLSLKDVKGSILSVSQFTLFAQTKKGNRPSYKDAATPQLAKNLYEEFNDKLRKENIRVETGVFGEDMEVSLINDGPVTIIIDSNNK